MVLGQGLTDGGCDGGPGISNAPGGVPGPTAAGRNLESLTYNVTPDTSPWVGGSGEVLQVVAVRCNARACPDCGPALGYELRGVLESKSDLFVVPQVLTFTVDPKNFESPRAALDYVTGGRYIARAFRRFGIKTWVWVLEFHKGREENNYAHRGWPHWHALIDVSERRFTPQDLRDLQRLCIREWKIGAVKLSRRKGSMSPVHAVRYITKYLTKVAFVPGWFVEGCRRRMVAGSKAIGALRFNGGRVLSRRQLDKIAERRAERKRLREWLGKEEFDAYLQRRRERKHSSPLWNRMGKCRLDCRILDRTEQVTQGGEVRKGRKCVSTPTLMWSDVAGRPYGHVDPLCPIGLVVSEVVTETSRGSWQRQRSSYYVLGGERGVVAIERRASEALYVQMRGAIYESRVSRFRAAA